MIARGFEILTMLLLLLLVGGYLGGYHPAGDSLAVFRPHVAGVLAVLTVLLWGFGRRRFAGVCVLALGISAGPLLWMYGSVSATGAAHLTLYQKNMLFRVADPGELGRDIMERQPDFVTLQEVSGANMAVFETLDATYSTRQFCPFETVGGVAVATRWPAVPGSGFCAERDGLAGLQVETPYGRVWLVSIHLHWPWPYSQPRHVDRLLPILEDLEGPVVIGGDFNMVPWSAALSRLAKAAQVQRIGPPHVTLTKMNGWMRVAIDHALVSGGMGTVERLDKLGSDHFGLLARFSLSQS